MITTPRAKLFDLHLRDYNRTINTATVESIIYRDSTLGMQPAKEVIRRAIFYGIKAYGFSDRTAKFDNQEKRFMQLEKIVAFIGVLTPNEFMQIFPLDKEFHGDRSGTRDYFTAIDEIKKIGADNIIGDPLMFLMNYWNEDVSFFLVNVIATMNHIELDRTGTDLFHHFFEGGTEHD